MGWDEALYSKAERWFGRRRAEKLGSARGPAAFSFSDIQENLVLWTSLLSGRTWTVQESEDWPSFDDERIYLPPVLEIFSSKELNRVAYYYIAANLVGCSEALFPELRKWRDLFQDFYQESGSKSHVPLSTFESERLFSGCAPALLSHAPLLLASDRALNFRKVMNLFIAVPIQASNVARNWRNESEGKKSLGNTKARKKKALNKIEVLNGVDQPDNENPLVHSFEKIHTTDDYNGGRKHQDVDDELDDHASSLEDLDLRQMIRSSQDTPAAMKGDFAMDIEVAESEELQTQSAVHKYPEWDYKKDKYLPDWCQIAEETMPTLSDEAYDAMLSERRQKTKPQSDLLRRQFVTLLKKPKLHHARADGPEIDVDAVVDLMSMPLQQRTGTPKIYLQSKRSFREASVIVLFDRSLSSDSWIDDKRIMDVIKDALVTIGDALDGFPISVQLACFSSQTRNHISYDILKPFDGSWRLGLNRLMQVEPAGYTRIGPALRHATRLLKKRKTEQKWIILLSDGKPTDLDRYEGRYGVQDVRMAVREAVREGVRIKCISIENRHRAELSEMFGQKGYELLTHPQHLPGRMACLLKNLVKKSGP